MTYQSEIDSAIKEKKVYFVGDKLPNDWYEAAVIWEREAKNNNVKAMHNIGRAYLLGVGVDDKDLKKAKYWLELAAENDDPRSHYLLSVYYKILGDSEKQLEYLKIAHLLGDYRASSDIKKLEEEKALYEASSLEKVKVDAFKSGKKALSLLFEDLSTFLETGDNEGAKRKISNFIDRFPDFKWVSNYLSYFSLSVKFNKVERLSLGQSSDSKKIRKFATFSINNNSNKDLKVCIIGYDSTSNTPKKEVILCPTVIVKAKSSATLKSKEIRGKSVFTYVVAGNWSALEPQFSHLISVQNNIVTEDDMKYFPVSIKDYEKSFSPPPLKLGYLKIKKTIKAKNSKCFIVTAASGSEASPIVDNYRLFRDNFLVKYKMGRAFIFYYYKFSPKLSLIISKKPMLRKISLSLLSYIIKFLPK